MQLNFIRRYVAPILVAVSLAACAQRADTADIPERAATVMGLRGQALSEPLAKPSFVLQGGQAGTGGAQGAYDFGRETEGKVTLLFFGYTHCPDVCPLHMANIAAALTKMPWEERDLVRVVFVTTDPERDTSERLQEWLGAFDPSFIGLRGDSAQVARIQRSLGLAPAIREAATPSGGYTVGHSAQVIAFGRDNVARVVYPFGTRQEDWAHDLPVLVREHGEHVTR